MLGGVVGGITGSLIGFGIPEYEAKRYEGRIKKGGILVSVHCDDSNWTHKAKTILQETGAEDVSSTGEARADFAKSDKPLPRRRVRGELVNKGKKPHVLHLFTFVGVFVAVERHLFFARSFNCDLSHRFFSPNRFGLGDS